VSDLPARVDVAIVGAGFAGAATARALARRGVRALVLEREAEIGRYASGRSAGLGRQLCEDDATTALAVRGAQLLRETPAWSPTGGILSFDRDAHADEYAARAERFGIAVERVDRAAVLQRWPALYGLPIAAALVAPSDGTIDVAALLAWLAADIEIARGVAVERVEPSGGGARVTTTRGTIDARVVVDAAGAWAGAIVGDAPLDTYKRHVFVLDGAVPSRSPWLWHLGDDEVYVRGDDGRTLTSPCDAAPCAPGDQQPDADGEAAIRARLRVAAPATERLTIRRAWACQRAFTPDRAMRLGRDRDRAWLVHAIGLGGHGATAALAVGERAADAVVAALA
jgi:D-arginine dehydrogenase